MPTVERVLFIIHISEGNILANLLLKKMEKEFLGSKK
jgi:hypothetical protein